MINHPRILVVSLLLIISAALSSQNITVSGEEGILNIRNAGEGSIRITLKPIDLESEFPFSPALSKKDYPEPGLSIKTLSKTVDKKIGKFLVHVSPDPLKIEVFNSNKELIQELIFMDDGKLSFKLDNSPVLGMGEGGPRVGRDWRDLPIEFDRRGRLHKMEPRWQGNSYGSRNPVAMLIGTGGWGIFLSTPWVQVDLSDKDTGLFIPRESLGLESGVQTQRDQQQNTGKGIPPSSEYVPGLYDLFVFDLSDPEIFFRDLSAINGQAVLPPLWSLGYMQSHRTLEEEDQLIDIVKTFREKSIPLDAVIYLGTGFCPQGWNTKQPSFDFNPEVFKREPSMVIDDLHALDVKVAVHIVPWDRDKLPTFQGNIPPLPGEKLDDSHLLTYWNQHEDLVKAGVDAWWPDEGDWFNLNERVKRHQLYYQGPLSTTPNVRPWSLHRNGYLGISKWGGWVWSGDTESSWKTLEGQIAVGINHSLSLSPFWGSDIGGFYPNEELDGELYTRWFQFAAFCPSFRSHGRTWWTRLPWGWGLSELGPLENRRNPLESELNNPEIEEVCRTYSELRYSLLSYNYTLAWEAREKGLPFMRAMWVHYPGDENLRGVGDQYLWGRDILVAPVYAKGESIRKLYLPEGDWYDWWTGEIISGGKTIKREVNLSIMPLYVKAGSIIPVDPIRQYTSQEISKPIEIRVYTGADAYFELYQDDGVSLNYLDGKETNLISFNWDNRKERLTIKNAEDKSYKGDPQDFKIVILPYNKVKDISFDGSKTVVKF